MAKAKARAKAKTGRGGVTVEAARGLALALPDTLERPSYGTPGFRARDILFARVLDDELLVVRVDLTSRDLLLDARPDLFMLTPHYVPYPWVVVRLGAITPRELREVLAEAHAVVLGEAAKKKRKALKR